MRKSAKTCPKSSTEEEICDSLSSPQKVSGRRDENHEDSSRHWIPSIMLARSIYQEESGPSSPGKNGIRERIFQVDEQQCIWEDLRKSEESIG